MYALCIAFAAIILIVLVLITGYLLCIGFSHLSLSFFIKEPIAQGNPGFPGGMANGLEGTTVLIALAGALGIPVGMLAGIYLAEYDTRSMFVGVVRFLADVLAGVPSIVVGILCYELLVAPVHRNNAWAGAAALAFIMIPIIARTTEEMLRLVPNSYREASIGLGGPRRTPSGGLCCRRRRRALLPGSCFRSRGSRGRQRRCCLLRWETTRLPGI